MDRQIVTQLLDEYRKAKSCYLLKDWQKSLLHSGRFCEVVLGAVKNIVDGTPVDLNKIKFDSLYKDLTSRTKSTAKDEILTLAIPRAARSVYTIRNKKRVAHVKAIDPDFIDNVYCMSACDWVLAELVFLLYTSNRRKASSLINSLLERKVPFIEEFENGSVAVLRTDLSFKEELLIVLYHRGTRLSNKKLGRLLKAKYPQRVTTPLGELERDRLVHRNRNGSKITRLGIKFVESKLLQTP